MTKNMLFITKDVLYDIYKRNTSEQQKKTKQLMGMLLVLLTDELFSGLEKPSLKERLLQSNQQMTWKH